MRKLLGISLGLSLSVCNLVPAFAQDQYAKPPKVLVITREFLKPGKGGSTHERSESAFVAAMKAANWPTRYFAADAVSGRPRSLFFTGYDSFEAWEKDNLAVFHNAGLSSATDAATIVDGELLSDQDLSVAMYREELSGGPPVKIEQMRYFEISRFVVKPGHGQEWEALVKGYKSAYEKALPDAHWAVFEDMYGMDNGGVFLIFTPMKSLSEVDKAMADGKKLAAAIGEAGMKKLDDLEASCVESRQSNLFMFNPKMSYPPDAWVKSDPDFWSAK